MSAVLSPWVTVKHTHTCQGVEKGERERETEEGREVCFPLPSILHQLQTANGHGERERERRSKKAKQNSMQEGGESQWVNSMAMVAGRQVQCYMVWQQAREREEREKVSMLHACYGEKEHNQPNVT